MLSPDQRLQINPSGLTTVAHCCKTPYTRYIGRPSEWGNPFEISKDGTRSQVISMYADWLYSQDRLLDRLHELKGHILGCWCSPKYCHGDVLAELANSL